MREEKDVNRKEGKKKDISGRQPVVSGGHGRRSSSVLSTERHRSLLG